MPHGIGLHVGPDADIEAVLAARPPVVVVMSTPTRPSHDKAAQIRAALPGCIVIGRHWEPDNAQLDQTKAPADEATRWFWLIHGFLTTTTFRGLYHATVGANEIYDNHHKDQFPWLIAFETALCRQLHAAGIPYLALKAPPGNIDAEDLGAFVELLALCAGVAADNYCGPDQRTMDPPESPWYARRPQLWDDWLLAHGRTLPPVWCTEVGTLVPWTQMGMSEADYVRLFTDGYSPLFDFWRLAVLDVRGMCAFAVGAEGEMGRQWNLSSGALRGDVATWNHQPGLYVPAPPQIPPTKGPIVTPKQPPPLPAHPFTGGFAEFSYRQPVLIGAPTSGPTSDAFGNVEQQTTTGRLLWHKAANVNWFFSQTGSAWRLERGLVVEVGT